MLPSALLATVEFAGLRIGETLVLDGGTSIVRVVGSATKTDAAVIACSGSA